MTLDVLCDYQLSYIKQLLDVDQSEAVSLTLWTIRAAAGPQVAISTQLDIACGSDKSCLISNILQLHY